MRHWRSIVILAVLGLSLGGQVPARAAAVKLATLVPEGSIWDKDLRALGDQWKRKTDGRVSLRIYAGGVAGSESDILRKMRIGQLHAAALTIVGLEEIDSAFLALGMPLFYESYEEFFYVMDRLAPRLEKRLEAKGYKLLHWAHGGWIRFFSRSPIHGIDDLRRQKIYVTAGADDMIAVWKENGFKPVPLAPTDIMTGLQTGMIDVIATPPLAALSLQWFRQASFMQETGLAPLAGATVIKNSVWDKISEADRRVLLADGAATEQRQRETIPEQDRIAIAEMSERGLEVTAADTSDEWGSAAARVAASVGGKMVPDEFYEAAKKLRDEYRTNSEAPTGLEDVSAGEPTGGESR